MKKLINNKYLFNRLIVVFFVITILLFLSINLFKTFSEDVTDTRSHIDGDTVYVNDLESDYYYYLGMNYVDDINSNSVTYSDSNLASVTVVYHGYGSDVNSCTPAVCGYVSLTERQNKFTYYKYYPVVNNEISIDLIDNPFSDRPDNKAFGGWTSTDGIITKDNKTNVQTIKVTKSGNNQTVNIYANWINAHVVYLKGTLGDDNFDGSTPDDAVGSWGRAFSLLQNNSTDINDRERNIIVLIGDLSMSPNYSRSITHTYNITVNYNDKTTFDNNPHIIEYMVGNTRYALTDDNGVDYTILSTMVEPSDDTKWIITESNGLYSIRNYDTNRYLSFVVNGNNVTLNMSNNATLWDYDSTSRKFYTVVDLSYNEYTYNDVDNIVSGEKYLVTNTSESNTLNNNLSNVSFDNRNYDASALWTVTNENGGYTFKNNNNRYLSSVDNGNNGADLTLVNNPSVWNYDNVNNAFYRQTLINYITYSYNHANYINSGSNYYITNGNDSNLIALSVNGNALTYFDMTDTEPTDASQWLLNNYGSGYTVRNVRNNRYLYSSNNGTLSTSNTQRVWMYNSSNHYLYYQRNTNTRYYLRYNNGAWSTTTNANQATELYFTSRVTNSSYQNTNVYLSFSNNEWGLVDTIGNNTTISLKTVDTNYISNIVNYYLRYNNGFEIRDVDSNNRFNFATYTVEREIRTTNTGNMTSNNNYTSSNNVAVTITSLYNHVDYRNDVTLDLTDDVDYGYAFVSAYNDLQLEYLSIAASGYNAVTNGTTTTDYSETYAVLEGNYNNVRIGRGMNPTSWADNSSSIFGIAYGGSDSSSLGSSNSHNNDYRFVIETGRYSSIMGVRIANDGNYSSNNAVNYYGKMTFVLGNDYDRISNTNDHLQIYYRAGSSNNYGIVGKTSSSEPAYLINVKSGNIGYKYFNDNPTDENRAYSGIYVGGLTVNATSSTTDISPRVLVMEGGYVSNIVGGLRLYSSYQDSVATKIYVKAGKVTNIVGGAGVSTTYGNRYISVTGGDIEYSVSGGSNGVFATDSTGQQSGKMQGSTNVHIGGKAKIGTIGSGELYGVSYGSVLGAGNGNNDVPNSGQVIKTKVSISDDAKIYGSVYGGGNYGNVTDDVTLKIDGGTIEGNVYGGANKNGIGEVDIQSGTGQVTSYVNHDNIVSGNGYLIVKENGTTLNALSSPSNNNINNVVLQNNSSSSLRSFWIITNENDGYTIKNASSNQYLNSETSLNNPTLKLDNNPTVWQYDSNNKTFYKQASYYNNYTVSYNFSTSMITGEEILITNSNSNTANSISVSNNSVSNTTLSSSTIPSNNLWVIEESDGEYTIRNVATGLYLYMASSGFFSYNLTLGSNPNTWQSDGRNFYYSTFFRTYYLTYNNGWTTTTNNSNANNFYFARYNVNHNELTDTFYLGFNNNWVLTNTNTTINNLSFKTQSVATNYVATASNRVNGDVNITMTGGEIKKALYGGSCEIGDVAGDITINILGGTINYDSDNNNSSLFGGGYGEDTNVAGNINVSIQDNKSVIIKGDSYGGSALGTVIGNINFDIDDTSSTPTISLQGDTYCGSMGNSLDNTLGNNMGSCTLNIKEGSYSNSFYGGNNSGGGSYGNITVNTGGYTNAATIGNVYGGGNEADSLSSDVRVYVKNNSSITKVFGGGNLASVPTTNVYLQGGQAIDVFGGSNKSGATTTNVYLQGGNFTNIYGGSNESGDVLTTNITLTGGNATTVYGGNNIGGTTTNSNILANGSTVGTIYGGGNEASTDITNVNLNSGNIIDVYGGGNKAGIVTNTNVNLNGSTTTNVFGGSNTSGVVPESNVIVTSGVANKVYGGNNVGGTTTVSNVTINGGNVTTAYGGGCLASTGTTNVLVNSSITNVYGGGESADVTVSTNVDVQNGTITNVFGGSNISGTVPVSNVDINNGTITNVFGGNNVGGTTAVSNVDIDGGTITTVYGGNNAGGTTTVSNVDINNGIVSNIYGGGCEANHGTSNVNFKSTSNNPTSYIFGGGKKASCTTTNVNLSSGVANYVFGGSDTSGVVGTSNVIVTGGTYTDIYGGNNAGGTTTNTNVNYTTATVTNIYGGGNNANVTGNTTVLTSTGTISNNVFGGGNNAAVLGSTDVTINGTTIGGSAYAGGNGVTATVHTNTNILVEGNSTITHHVFGGGNAAYTGILTSNNSKGRVNIIGGNIGGNVYGGANTSVLYGDTMVNIGYNSVVANIGNEVNINDLVKSDINIAGTVFGGGEANASGSEDYDYSFISVTVGIIINIDGATHNNFDIGGSIFGSGNASSTTGYSRIYINNYGTESDIKENISIQRADLVVLNNSNIELSGATDRTNEYSSVLFSVSRIDELDLVNNSTLYFQNGANLLKKFRSLKDNNTLATVTIDEDNETVTKNVNNRIYMLEDKILNIATNQNITSYGEVDGMTFLGMYKKERTGEIVVAMYDTDYNYGDTANNNDIYYFSGGTYVLGLHEDNHNIEVDGFYSNFVSDEEGEGNTLKVKYIVPTPEDSSYYMWIIGTSVTSYEVDLVASKYSTLGTYELPLIDYTTANTYFTVVGFQYENLDSDVSLVAPNSIPRIANNSDDADNRLGLSIRPGTEGWITLGSTEFLTESDNNISGTTTYYTENSSMAPSLLFYLYHSKNLATNGNLGYVTIKLLAITPINDLEKETTRIDIVVNLSRAIYQGDFYEAAMTPGRQYEFFSSSPTRITSKSSLSAYYALYVNSDTSIYRNGYHHSLVSDKLLPVNTKITMIDFASGSSPEYYYYITNANDNIDIINNYNLYLTYSYDLSKFIKMGSSSVNNTYDEETLKNIYYNQTNKMAVEEFIFIVDFCDAEIASNYLETSLLMEIRTSTEQTIYSVLGTQHDSMKYDLYYDSDGVIDVSATLSDNVIHVGNDTTLRVTTSFELEKDNSNNNILDTTYYDNKLGIKLTIFDENNNQVNGIDLMGVSFIYNGITHYPRSDGTVRINLAEKVANVYSSIIIDTTDGNLSGGNYTLKVESFYSPDGIYYGIDSSDECDVSFRIMEKNYGLDIVLDDEYLIIDHETSHNLNDNNQFNFNILYSSSLVNPNLRIALFRRTYNNVYDLSYELVDIKDYLEGTFNNTSDENVYKFFTNPGSNVNNQYILKDNLITGTYKLVIYLYDGDVNVGNIYKYFVIK